MTDEEILSKVFTTGDSNNNYIELTGGEISVVQLLEPAIAVDQFTIKESDHRGDEMYPERLSFRIPLVSINDQRIEQHNIVNFNLDYSSFLPTVMVEFTDFENNFLSTAFPREGSIIHIYVGGNGDELYYKPIRQDFIITSINRSGNPGTTQRFGGTLKYKVTGTLLVPAAMRRESWSDSSVNSTQALFNLALYTGLGFATNFTKSNTVDTMQWINSEKSTLMDFMKDITRHACYSQYTFFTSFIDQYYVLNFVECHSLLSHGGNKTDMPAMIYSNTQQISRPNNDAPDNIEKKPENEIVLHSENEEELDNLEQKVSYYFITNSDYFIGWSNFIEVYSELNNGGSSLSDGYRVHLSYSDASRGSDWGCTNCEFVLAPIDNLKRDPITHQIDEFPEDVTQESYIPLNLAQTTSPVYLNNDLNSPDNIAVNESFVSGSEIEGDNMHKLYTFANYHNSYQMRCMKKCGLNVKLQNYNPAITKFSRIWVDIFDKNHASSTKIKPMELLDSWSDEYKELVEEENDNILFFEDEFFGNRDPLKGTYNRALSGWYVVTEMKITYNKKRQSLQTELVLNRIEHKPNLKSEYELARDAINEKYRFDNTMGSWFNNMDAFVDET